MPRLAVVRKEDGHVVNVIVAPKDFPVAKGYEHVETALAGPGWTYANGEFIAPPIVPPVPQQISGWRGRTVMQLHELEESILKIIGNLPEPTKTIAINGYAADIFMRDSALLNTILKLLKKTDAEIDAYFIEAAALPN